jgi:cation diffusion facilitator CzcD-associated flavoprotein CzcO
MVNPDMCTNISRHVVSFSDFAWPEGTREFPKAWEVGRYLERYAERYRLTNKEIRTGWKVVWAKRNENNHLENGLKRWSVKIEKVEAEPAVPVGEGGSSRDAKSVGTSSTESQLPSNNKISETHEFDHVIVASGFFGKPNVPSAFQSSTTSHIPVLHSTQFRSIKDLLKVSSNGLSPPPGKILVVGGSMSGVEVASSVAMQLSSEANSPQASDIKDIEKYTVHHLVRRPLWIMPLFLPTIPILESDDDTKVRDPSVSANSLHDQYPPLPRH